MVFQIDEFFERSKSGAIWGTIYFRDEQGRAFPDAGWTDLVAAFLRHWLNTLINVPQGTSFTQNIPFYDGPMEVTLNADAMGLVELIFLKRDEPQFVAEERMSDLLIESVRVANELLKACEERQWQNADTAAITSLVQSCTNLITRNRG